MTATKISKKNITVMSPPKVMTVDKEKYHQKRVAAYCRVSTDSEEQLTSYTTQKKVYTEMIAARPDWELAGIYADEGISGTRADKRPQFQKMIKDCFAGKIDYIVTKSVSRFARNTVWCCIIKVDTLFSRILIYNHNQYENRRKTYGTESKIL